MSQRRILCCAAAAMLIGSFAFGQTDGGSATADKNASFQQLRQDAEQGDADAQNKLGNCYENGEGVEKDQAQAVYWFRKAAERGGGRGS